MMFRELLAEMYEQVIGSTGALRYTTNVWQKFFAGDAACQRLKGHPGIGPMVGALVAAVGDAHTFKNGRQLAAWVGLVPRQHNTGGRPRLPGISKRGIAPAGTADPWCPCGDPLRRGQEDRLSRWILRLQARRGTNVATVALANKLARMAWVVLSREENYHPSGLPTAS